MWLSMEGTLPALGTYKVPDCCSCCVVCPSWCRVGRVERLGEGGSATPAALVAAPALPFERPGSASGVTQLLPPFPSIVWNAHGQHLVQH